MLGETQFEGETKAWSNDWIKAWSKAWMAWSKAWIEVLLKALVAPSNCVSPQHLRFSPKCLGEKRKCAEALNLTFSLVDLTDPDKTLHILPAQPEVLDNEGKANNGFVRPSHKLVETYWQLCGVAKDKDETPRTISCSQEL